jgi:hypothetical protein
MGSLLRSALGWVIVIAVGIILLKLVIGAVFGLLQMFFAIALIVVVVMGVLWALRHL